MSIPKPPPTMGADSEVTLLDGRRVRYVNLDNTATTPPFVEVHQTVTEFLAWYGSVHRGSGYKSFFSTWMFEQARRRIGEFVGADPTYHEVIFTSNTTSAINKAARVLQLRPKDIVLVSQIEHSSNDLPWRRFATLDRYSVLDDMGLDLKSIQRLLERHGARVRLVVVTGASNVTGYIPPYHDIARLAHRHGVPIFVDSAQLVPHRRLEMLTEGDQRHLDFIAFSAHKLGAPYGTGVLIGPRSYFEPRNVPSDEPGGGTTDILTETQAYWTTSPDRFEGGTPNAVGAIALARSVQLLATYGMDNVRDHEMRLWLRAVKGLKRIRGVSLYVREGTKHDHTPLLPFNCDGYPHGLVAAFLGFECGIGVRHGRHCADRLVLQLLGLDETQRRDIVRRVVDRGRMIDIYGVVRPSIGLCNTDEDIDRLVEGVARLMADGPRFMYTPEWNASSTSARRTRQTGEYLPKGFSVVDLLSRGNPPAALLSLRTPVESRANKGSRPSVNSHR